MEQKGGGKKQTIKIKRLEVDVDDDSGCNGGGGGRFGREKKEE